MSRKSARLSSRSRRGSEDVVEIVPQSRKRKAEEDVDMDVNRKRPHTEVQNQWLPISLHSAIPPGVLVASTNYDPNTATVLCNTAPPTPESQNSSICTVTQIKDHLKCQPLIGETYQFKNIFVTPVCLRNSPLPSLQWADSREVWTLMLQKEEIYLRDQDMLSRHPGLQARMRSILLDWLIEVCEVYRLHRETYFLSVDFIDRYLTIQKGISKQQLQLIGITSLFIAAKLEEIYPPKLNEFAYVTDGACTENEILDQELVMLKALKWDLSPMTCNAWLNIYLQLVNIENLDDKENGFEMPQYSAHAFIQIAQVLDLCFLDIGCLKFTYSVLATAAMYHRSGKHVALSVSGYEWSDIAACVQWMAPFAMTLREAGDVDLKFFQHVPHENTHNIQTHVVDLSLLEKAQSWQTVVDTSSRSSPDYTKSYPGIITPPQSKGKQRTALD